MTDNIRRLTVIADNLLEIPANEQAIGILQMAIREALSLIAAELRDLRQLTTPVTR